MFHFELDSTIDARGDIAVLNPQARRMLGLGPAEKMPPEEFKKKIAGTELEAALAEHAAKKSPVAKDIVVRQDAEERAVLRCDVSPVKNEEAIPIGTMVVLRDVTKERAFESLKSDFISMVSHEMRTPLAVMKGYVGNMRDALSGEITPQQAKSLDVVARNIDRLALIINDLLDISKLESGTMKLSRKAASLLDLAKASVAFFQAQAAAKNVALDFVGRPGLSEAYMDPDRINQVLVNLIGNALKFTPEQGKITVAVLEDGGFLEMRVTDTGPGIAPSNFEKIFNRFEQLGRQDGAGAKGVGLGLAIAKQIVELHGGRIRVQSPAHADGTGSRFIVRLPRSAPEKRAVMVVDDDAAVRGMMRRILGELGHQPLIAPDSEAALAAISKENVDLVFLDLKMPGKNGVELFRELKGRNPAAQVVVITGFPDGELLAQAMKLGPVTVIAKPFTQPQIRDVTQRLLARRTETP